MFYRRLQISFRSNRIRATATKTIAFEIIKRRKPHSSQLIWFGFSYSWIFIHYHAHRAHSTRNLNSRKEHLHFFPANFEQNKSHESAHVAIVFSVYFVVGIFNRKNGLHFIWLSREMSLPFVFFHYCFFKCVVRDVNTHSLARTESCALRTTVNYCQIHMLFHGTHARTHNKILMKDKYSIGKCSPVDTSV